MDKLNFGFFTGKFKKFNSDKTITHVIKQDNTSQILINMPNGWAGTVIAGTFIALFSWFIPVSLSLFAYLSSTDNPALNDYTWFDSVLVGTQFWALSMGIPISFGSAKLSIIPIGYTLIVLLSFIWLATKTRFYTFKASLGLLAGFVSTVLLLGILLPHGIKIWKLLLASLLLSIIAVLITLVKKDIFSFGYKIDDEENYFDLFIYQFPIKNNWFSFAREILKKNIIVLFSLCVFIFVTSVIFNYKEFQTITTSLHADPLGWVVLLVIQILYIPVIMVWLFGYYTGGTIYLGDVNTQVSAFEKPEILFPNIPAMAWINTIKLGWPVYTIIPILSLAVCVLLYKKFFEEKFINIVKIFIYIASVMFVSLITIFYFTSGSIAGKHLELFGVKILFSAFIIVIQIVITQFLFFTTVYLLRKYNVYERTFNSKKPTGIMFDLNKRKDQNYENTSNENLENIEETNIEKTAIIKEEVSEQNAEEITETITEVTANIETKVNKEETRSLLEEEAKEEKLALSEDNEDAIKDELDDHDATENSEKENK